MLKVNSNPRKAQAIFFYKHHQRGMSLIELLVALVLSGLISILLMNIYSNSNLFFLGMETLADVQELRREIKSKVHCGITRAKNGGNLIDGQQIKLYDRNSNQIAKAISGAQGIFSGSLQYRGPWYIKSHWEDLSGIVIHFAKKSKTSWTPALSQREKNDRLEFTNLRFNPLFGGEDNIYSLCKRKRDNIANERISIEIGDANALLGTNFSGCSGMDVNGHVDPISACHRICQMKYKLRSGWFIECKGENFVYGPGGIIVELVKEPNGQKHTMGCSCVR